MVLEEGFKEGSLVFGGSKNIPVSVCVVDQQYTASTGLASWEHFVAGFVCVSQKRDAWENTLISISIMHQFLPANSSFSARELI